MIGALLSFGAALLGIQPYQPIAVGPVVGVPVHVGCEPADMEAWVESGLLLPGENVSFAACSSLSGAFNREKLLERRGDDWEPDEATRGGASCRICLAEIEEGDEVMLLPLTG